MKITYEMLDAYRKHPHHCPFCKEENIIARRPKTDDDFVRIEIDCPDCDKTWSEIYIFKTIECEEYSNE